MVATRCTRSSVVAAGGTVHSTGRLAAHLPPNLRRPPTHPTLPAGTFCVTSNSRMLYAFARDKGIFGWRWWKEVRGRCPRRVGCLWH